LAFELLFALRRARLRLVTLLDRLNRWHACTCQ
jgi:hypothetical protein